MENVPARENGSAHPKLGDVKLGTSVLVYAYIGLAVLRQSDAELILPTSRFDIGEFLGTFKEGLPGGTFLTPLLSLKIPLFYFYTLSPLALLALHAWIVLHPRMLHQAPAWLRAPAIWLPPATLALIWWRFAPYVAARPVSETPTFGEFLVNLQTIALALDVALVILALIRERSIDLPARGRLGFAALMTMRHTGILVLATVLARGTRVQGPSPIDWLLAAVLLAAWLFGGQAHQTSPSPEFHSEKEDLDMRGRILVALACLTIVTLPLKGRALDLSGESLVAKAPSEIMIAALVAPAAAERPQSEGAGQAESKGKAFKHAARHLALAQRTAWSEFGRGIALAGWRLREARFDGATMARIQLAGADLGSASLVRANLIDAQLQGASLVAANLQGADMQLAQAGTPPSAATSASSNCDGTKRTNFSFADLRGADLTEADLSCAILRGVLMDATTVLQGTILTNADLCGSDLAGVDLSAAGSLQSSRLDYADLQGALLPVGMKGAKLMGAHIAGASFKSSTDDTPPTLENGALRLASQNAPAQTRFQRAELCKR